MQYHNRRAECWVVVEGAADLVGEKENYRLEVGESIFIPVGVPHRLENKEKKLLKIVEIQLGDYFEETILLDCRTYMAGLNNEISFFFFSFF